MKSRLPGLGVLLDVRALTEHAQIPWFDPQKWKKRGFQRILQKVRAGEMVWRTKIHLPRIDTSFVLRASTLVLNLPLQNGDPGYQGSPSLWAGRVTVSI